MKVFLNAGSESDDDLSDDGTAYTPILACSMNQIVTLKWTT
jgi:hypothetical protein